MKKGGPSIPKPKEPSKLEVLFLSLVREAGLPEPEPQLRLVPGRKFAFDFSWPEAKLTVEVQGGTWVKGGHSSGSGIAKDAEKSILAQLEGWRVFPVTSNQIKSGEAIEWVTRGLVLWTR